MILHGRVHCQGVVCLRLVYSVWSEHLFNQGQPLAQILLERCCWHIECNTLVSAEKKGVPEGRSSIIRIGIGIGGQDSRVIFFPILFVPGDSISRIRHNSPRWRRLGTHFGGQNSLLVLWFCDYARPPTFTLVKGRVTWTKSQNSISHSLSFLKP